MGIDSAATFGCEACGKKYRWKPEFAGRKVKCKCGAVIAPKPPEAMPQPEDRLYDLAPEPKAPAAPSPRRVQPVAASDAMPRDMAMPAGAVPAGAVAHPAGPISTPHGARPRKFKRVLPYQTSKREEDNGEASARFNDIYLPTGLILLGMILAYVEAFYGSWGLSSFPAATLLVFASTAINLVLIFIGLLISVKLLSLGLGSPGQAILKVTAVALLPASVGNLVGEYTGEMGGYFGWCVSLILYYALFMKLFDLDFQETMICTAIIWVVRTFVGMFIIIWLASMWARGFDDPAPAGGGAPWVYPDSGDEAIEEGEL